MKYLHSRNIMALLYMLVLMACGSNKAAVATSSEVERPDWVKQRPIDMANYIGVGSASKINAPLDFNQVAKKNALNDLASEISIKVEAESFLNTMEYGSVFNEEFNSTIKTTISEEIEGYEILYAWEDEDEYWICYRLNKADHQRIKTEKKQDAIDAALALYETGLLALEERRIEKSVQLMLLGLQELKPYWNESIRTQMDGRTVFLDNEIYSEILDVVNSLNLKSPVKLVELNMQNDFEVEVPFQVYYKNQPAQGVPVFYDFKRIKYKRPQGLYTDESGAASARVNQISRFETNNRLEIQIDKLQLFDALDDRMLKKALEKKLTSERLSMPIGMNLPKISVVSYEKKLGKLDPQKTLAQTAKTELSKLGFILTDNVDEAGFVLTIEANTAEGGTQHGFFACFANVTLKMTKGNSSGIVYEMTEGNIKGMQLNFGTASDEAYRKAALKMKNEWVPKMLETII